MDGFYYEQANHNNSDAQFSLACICLNENSVQQNINKAIYYLTMASKNGHVESSFCLGVIYHQGYLIQRDIKKAIHYYKEASSFGDHYAKNNLSIIYKGSNEIEQNISNSIIYLNEAISKNDIVSMAHIYFFNENVDLDKSEDLLIQLANKYFYPSKDLLALLLVKKLKIIT